MISSGKVMFWIRVRHGNGDPGGMPCLILGPRGDNLHAPDEWVLLEDIYTLTEAVTLLAARWCS